MKSFQSIANETLEAENLEELEAAADLFEFGIEKGYYSITEAQEFNDIYWKAKNRFLAFQVAETTKGNILDIMSIVSNAPGDIKDSNQKLIDYVKSRLKALKGISGAKR